MQATQEHGVPYLIIGVGLGLLAGLLWAPRAGKEMRDELRRGADEAQKVRVGAEHWFTKIRERFSRRKTSGSDDAVE